MSRLTIFGQFEANLSSCELRKQGRLVRLQQLPFELLRLLLERPNEVVTRDELRKQLWPGDAVVDVDRSLNKSVAMLRGALGDSASSPRFIETLPKRGYRFIATVAHVESQTSPADPPIDASALARIVAPVTPGVGTAVTPTGGQLWTLLPTVFGVALIAALLFSLGPARRASEARGHRAAAATDAGAADATASDPYARGRIALSRRSEDGLRSAIRLFERAVERDPGHAAAYVGLADAWSLLASYGVEEPRTAMGRAREFANRALAIDAESPEAHTSLGRTAMLSDWDWALAEGHFLRAIASNANYATAHQWYAYLLSATGRHVEAEREALKAAALDPRSPIATTSVGYVLYAARRFNDAAAALHRVLEIDPDFMQARKNLGLVLAAQGQYSQAILEFERVVRLSGGSAVAQADLAWARGLAGDVAGARRLLTDLRAKQARGYVPLDSLSMALVGGGQMTQAVTALDAAFKSRDAGISRLAVDPRWDALRDLPQVRTMADAVKAGLAR